MIDDLSKAKRQVYSDIKKMFNVKVPLDPRQEEMLTDYTSHYCQSYLMKYRNITTLGQLGKILADYA